MAAKQLASLRERDPPTSPRQLRVDRKLETLEAGANTREGEEDEESGCGSSSSRISGSTIHSLYWYYNCSTDSTVSLNRLSVFEMLFVFVNLYL